MTEQQYRVIADRDKGDDPDQDDVREGDRVTTVAVMEGTPRTGRVLRARIDRIERPVPTTDTVVHCGEYQDHAAHGDCVGGPNLLDGNDNGPARVWPKSTPLTEAEADSFDSAMQDQRPSVPTREQIAEEAEKRYPALNPDADELTYPRSALRGFKRGAFAEGVAWALALLQKGGDRG